MNSRNDGQGDGGVGERGRRRSSDGNGGQPGGRGAGRDGPLAYGRGPQCGGGCEPGGGSGGGGSPRPRWPVSQGSGGENGSRPAAEVRDVVSRHLDLVEAEVSTRLRRLRPATRRLVREDLFQEGCVALVRAATQYDPARHGAFAAYATRGIRGAIVGALVNGLCIVRTPARRSSAQDADRGGKVDLVTLHSGYESLSDWRRVDLLALEAPSPQSYDGVQERIRHALRRRFERAVAGALTELRDRRSRRRNPLSVFARIAQERLLVGDAGERTPLREIARGSGASCSRVGAYERQLLDVVRRHFSEDPQVRLLVQFANEDAARFDSLVTSAQRRRLRQAEIEAFDSCFTQLDAPARAALVYEMIARTTGAMPEVARNLYCLTLDDADAA